MFVADRMTPNPVTISPDTTVTAAQEMMKNNRFRRLPVMDGEKLVGWVTEEDLRQVAPSSATTLSVYEINYLLAKLKIVDVMIKDVIVVKADAPIEEAALLMLQYKIGGMPVLDADEKVVGVVTETDIFKAFLEMSGVATDKTTRFTLKVSDRVGVLEALGGLFARKGLSIASIAVYQTTEDAVKLILRVRGAEEETRAAIPDIENLGIEIIAVHFLAGGK